MPATFGLTTIQSFEGQKRSRLRFCSGGRGGRLVRDKQHTNTKQRRNDGSAEGPYAFCLLENSIYLRSFGQHGGEFPTFVDRRAGPCRCLLVQRHTAHRDRVRKSSSRGVQGALSLEPCVKVVRRS